jgi:hypothetical protein
MNSRIVTLGVLLIAQPLFADFAFVHPGLLHSGEDLARMKAAVAAKQEPIFAGFEVFRAHSASQATYPMKGPFEEIGRSPNIHFSDFDQDANAAYQCAIMWAITDNPAYAEKSKAILNGWSATLKRCTGADAVLMAGLGPFKLINAAEIIRYTDPTWSEADMRQCERMFKEVIYPVTRDFALFANGNWDAAALKMNLSIGVFCNDRAIFERALCYYVNGGGNGRLTHYVINETGQCQESGRDQPHTQLGLALLGDCCEIAWHQGLNLYAYADNRLLKGFEYTAKYNLGEQVPFTETRDRTGKYHHTAISTTNRGRLRAVFEQIYHHYVNRMGIPAPYTQKAAEKIRPEGPGVPSADHPGFGTLFFTRPPANPNDPSPTVRPAAPGVIIAQGTASAIQLTWVAPVNAVSYAVKRATTSGGPYKVIAKNIPSPHYTDTRVHTGKVYYYTVTASNAMGESPDALETSMGAGLPKPWTHQDVGAVAAPGSASSDGRGFTIEGAGADLGGTSDQFQFTCVPMKGDGAMIARFVPPISSQFSKFGLMMREALTADAANVSLLFAPRSGESGVERLSWNVSLATRASAGAETRVTGNGASLSAPYVTHGRLMQPYWLKLERSGHVFTGSMGPDGQTWTRVGSVTNALKGRLRVGLAACSRITQITTTIQFDHVTLQRKKARRSPSAPTQAHLPDGPFKRAVDTNVNPFNNAEIARIRSW